MATVKHPANSMDIAVQRFPERTQQVEHEYQISASFRGLCDDLCLCAEALSRWRRKEDPEGKQRAEEYAQSLAELEQEMSAWLDDRQKPR